MIYHAIFNIQKGNQQNNTKEPQIVNGIIQKFLRRYGTTMYQVAKETGLSKATIESANKKSVDQMSAKNIRLIAENVELSPGNVLNELYKIEKDDENNEH